MVVLLSMSIHIINIRHILSERVCISHQQIKLTAPKSRGTSVVLVVSAGSVFFLCSSLSLEKTVNMSALTVDNSSGSSSVYLRVRGSKW